MIRVVQVVLGDLNVRIAEGKRWSWRAKISVGAATTFLARGSSALLSSVVLSRLLSSSD